jgi:hypothetical protein
MNPCEVMIRCMQGFHPLLASTHTRPVCSCTLVFGTLLQGLQVTFIFNWNLPLHAHSLNCLFACFPALFLYTLSSSASCELHPASLDDTVSCIPLLYSASERPPGRGGVPCCMQPLVISFASASAPYTHGVSLATVWRPASMTCILHSSVC